MTINDLLSFGDAADDDPSTEQVENAEESTIVVTHEDADGYVGESSGLVLDSHKAVLPTHIGDVEKGDHVEMVTADGNQHDAEIIGFVRGQDAAIVETKDDLGDHVPTIADDDAIAGEHVVAVDVLHGTTEVHEAVMGKEDPTGSGDNVTTHGDFKPGMSGAPLVNEDGDVVGIVEATNSETDVGIVLNKDSLDEIIAAAKSGDLSDKPTQIQYPDGTEPIATQAEVDAAKRAAEQAKNDAYRREQEAYYYKQQQYRAEHS